MVDGVWTVIIFLLWYAKDEGATHYAEVIDQMTKGHRFLLNEFNIVPTIGWQIGLFCRHILQIADTFGHAATQAKLFAQMGFDAVFMGRIEYSEHDYRNSTKQLEFIWRPYEEYGDQYDIFTHILISNIFNDLTFTRWLLLDPWNRMGVWSHTNSRQPKFTWIQRKKNSWCLGWCCSGTKLLICLI